VIKFDHNLKLLDIFGSEGDEDNQFIEPRGIAIYKRFGQVFVAEKKGAQYFWVGTNLKKALLIKKGEGFYSLTVHATEFSYITLFSLLKKDTVTYIKKHWIPVDSATIDFETGDKKEIRNTGLLFKIEPTYSSLTYSSWYYPIKVEVKK
jgi:hypothetical protein